MNWIARHRPAATCGVTELNHKTAPREMNKVSPASFETGVKRHAAVDVEGCSRDIIGVVGREPHGSAANLVGLTDAFVGDQLEQIGIGSGCAPSLRVDGRPNRAGGYAVHANAVGCDF